MFRPGQSPDESAAPTVRSAPVRTLPQRKWLQRPGAGHSGAGHRSARGSTHGHLWSLPDGTGLHAPHGELVVEAGTGRLCCHLCGRWFVSLGGHLRAHGHTAESYREAMGLCRTRRLVAEPLSRSIAARQARAYRRSSAVRARLAAGQELTRTGQLTRLARSARAAREAPELVRIRQSQARQAEADAARRVGADDLRGWLRQHHSAGWSLTRLAEAVGHSRHWVRSRLGEAHDSPSAPHDQLTTGGHRG